MMEPDRNSQQSSPNSPTIPISTSPMADFLPKSTTSPRPSSNSSWGSRTIPPTSPRACRLRRSLDKVDSAAALPYAQEAVKLDQMAIPDLEISAKAFPHDAKVFFALGSAYSRAGRKEEAARARATFQRLNQQSSEEAKPAN